VSAKSELSVHSNSRLVVVGQVYIVTCLSPEDVFIIPASVLRDLKNVSKPLKEEQVCG
jgi:hypothetical protein